MCLSAIETDMLEIFFHFNSLKLHHYQERFTLIVKDAQIKFLDQVFCNCTKKKNQILQLK